MDESLKAATTFKYLDG